MAEDGREILRRLEQEPTTTILLQPCHQRWAVCDAGECTIVFGDKYRVVLGTRNRKYFHISCVETMVDLVSLPQSRFGLDMGTWGLMPRAWFEHNGRIDLAKIAAYIDAYAKYEEARDDHGSRHVDWQMAHMTKCTVSRELCDCPPEPKAGFVQPTLHDYTTNETCTISEVVRHPYAEKRGICIASVERIGTLLPEHGSHDLLREGQAQEQNGGEIDA